MLLCLTCPQMWICWRKSIFLQVALGEVESERDNLLEMKEKMQSTQRGLSESEERESLLLKDIEDLKAKHAFAQAEFEQERDELNDVVTKSKLLLQVHLSCTPILLFCFDWMGPGLWDPVVGFSF